MEERLRKDYPWLFTKSTFTADKGKKTWTKHELTPTIEDCGSHYRVTREPGASPLILSKNYGT